MHPATEPDSPQFVSPARLASRLGIHERTIRRAIDAGTLPAYRVGKLIRIDLNEAERALLKPMNAKGTRS